MNFSNLYIYIFHSNKPIWPMTSQTFLMFSEILRRILTVCELWEVTHNASFCSQYFDSELSSLFL